MLIRKLTAINKGIIELKWIDHLVNLTELDLSQNKIVNLEEVKFPDNLQNLDLSNNQIDTIAGFEKAFSKLNKFFHVCMRNNPITESSEYHTVIVKIEANNPHINFTPR